MGWVEFRLGEKGVEPDRSWRPAEASGRIWESFFVTTSKSDSWAAAYVNQAADEQLLNAYSHTGRDFLLHSPAGQIRFGGPTHLFSPQPDDTKAEALSVPPTDYSISLYLLDEDKVTECVRSAIGEADYDYYERKRFRPPWGVALLALAIIVALSGHYWIAGFVLLFSVGYLFFEWRSRTSNARYNELSAQVNALHKQYPDFIVELQGIGAPALSRGWYVID